VPRLFADLDLAHGDGRFARLFRMLVKVDLLVMDDWGPDRLSASQRRDLMEIVEDRHGKPSGRGFSSANSRIFAASSCIRPGPASVRRASTARLRRCASFSP
jgi:DNA replication protein DnaC